MGKGDDDDSLADYFANMLHDEENLSQSVGKALRSMLMETYAETSFLHIGNILKEDPQESFRLLLVQSLLVFLRRRCEPWLKEIGLRWIDIQPILENRLQAIGNINELSTRRSEALADPI